jgi:hypothetical protein
MMTRSERRTFTPAGAAAANSVHPACGQRASPAMSLLIVSRGAERARERA